MCIPETEQHSSVFGVGPMSNTQAQILLSRNILLPLFSLHSSSMSCLPQTCGLVRACDEIGAERYGDTPNDGLITERRRLCAGQRPLSLLFTAFSCIFSHINRLVQTDGAHSHVLYSLRCSHVWWICFLVCLLYFLITFFVFFFIIFHKYLMVSASSFSKILKKWIHSKNLNNVEAKASTFVPHHSEMTNVKAFASRSWIFMLPLHLSLWMQRYSQYLLLATRLWVQFLFGAFRMFSRAWVGSLQMRNDV